MRFVPAVGILALLALAPSTAAAATASFGYTGSEQTFVVPAGVTSVTVGAVGGRGGSPGGGDAVGGYGAHVTATVPVAPGQILYIEVGGNGGAGSGVTGGTAGFNGGAAGGSSSGGGGGGGGGASGADGSATSVTVAADSTGTPGVTIAWTVPTAPPSDPPADPPAPALGDVAVSGRQRGRAVTGAVNIGQSNSILLVQVFGDAPRYRKAPQTAKRLRLGRLLQAPVASGLKMFSVRLSKKGRRALRKRRRLALTPRITVTPPSGAAGVATRKVVLRRG